ncbi:MAG TPA: hypothetical protein VIK88_01810 [Candidatus Bathyarchaeia archaeon]
MVVPWVWATLMSAEELLPTRTISPDPRISVVGVGGAGNNLLTHAIGSGLSPNHCVAVNTDRSQLSKSLARNKVLLGNGGEIEEVQAKKDLQLSIRRVTPFTDASDFTIVVTGLGGGTGTGAAPLIAQWSRSQVCPVVSVVAIPFIHERERRFVALRGLKKMVEACDCTVVIDNSMESDAPSSNERRADELASLAVSGLTDLMSRMGPVQKQNFRRIVSLGPIATLCSAPVRSRDKIQSAVFEALKNPSARFPLSKTRGAVLFYRGPDAISDGHAVQAYDTVASLAGHEVEFFYGSVQRDSDPRICLLLTGYDYGTAVQTFVEFIELYDIEYGQTNPGSVVHLQVPLFQMEQA